MEKFCNETVTCISEFYDDGTHDGKDLVKSILSYHYNTTVDDSFKERIEQWFKSENCCIVCGCELKTYEVEDEDLGYKTIKLCQNKDCEEH